MYTVSFLGWNYIQKWYEPWPMKTQSNHGGTSSKNKKELLAFLGKINYLSKVSASTADICIALRQLKLVKTEWSWNADYHKFFDKAKSIIRADTCMKFYDKTKPLYLETDAPGVELGVSLLQTRNCTSCPRDTAPENNILRPIAFASKSLSSTEKRYSNIEREALGILHGLEKFHDYCFARKVSIITDHKPLVSIFKEDMSTLLQRLQQILHRIHQYRFKIIYKPGPNLFIADWLSKHKA